MAHCGRIRLQVAGCRLRRLCYGLKDKRSFRWSIQLDNAMDIEFNRNVSPITNKTVRIIMVGNFLRHVCSCGHRAGAGSWAAALPKRKSRSCPSTLKASRPGRRCRLKMAIGILPPTGPILKPRLVPSKLSKLK
jgi:hypothetical protein